MILYGTNTYGHVDQVDELFGIKTQFFHIWFFPVIPLKSLLVFEEDSEGARGVPIPLNAKSMLVAWFRTVMVGAFFASLIFAFVNGDGIGTTILYSLACVVTIGLLIASYCIPAITDASYERAIELSNMAGLGPVGIQYINSVYGQSGGVPGGIEGAGYSRPHQPGLQPGHDGQWDGRPGAIDPYAQNPAVPGPDKINPEEIIVAHPIAHPGQYQPQNQPPGNYPVNQFPQGQYAQGHVQPGYAPGAYQHGSNQTNNSGKSNVVLWSVLGGAAVLGLSACGGILVPAIQMANNRPDVIIEKDEFDPNDHERPSFDPPQTFDNWDVPESPEPDSSNNVDKEGSADRRSDREIEQEERPAKQRERVNASLQELIDLLASSDSAERSRAASALVSKEVDELKRGEVARALEATKRHTGNIEHDALRALASWAVPANVPALLYEYDNPIDPERRNDGFIIDALAQTNDERATRVYALHLASSRSVDALKALGNIAADEVAKQINSSNYSERQVAISLLKEWNISESEITSQTVLDLSSEDVDVIDQAADRLFAMVVDTEIQEDIASGLEVAIKRTDIEVPRSVITALTKWERGDESAAAAAYALQNTIVSDYRFKTDLLRLLRNIKSNATAPILAAHLTDQQNRAHAFAALRGLDAEVAGEAAVQYFNTSNRLGQSLVRRLVEDAEISGSRILEQCANDLSGDDASRYDAAIQWVNDCEPADEFRERIASGLNHVLEVGLQDSAQTQTVRYCLDAMAIWGDDRSIAMLGELVKSPNVSNSRKAIRSLGTLNDPDAYDEIAAGLTRSETRPIARMVLIEIGTDAETAVLELAHHEDESTRIEVCHVLAEIGTLTSTGLLKSQLQVEEADGNHRAKSAIQNALDKIESRN